MVDLPNIGIQERFEGEKAGEVVEVARKNMVGLVGGLVGNNHDGFFNNTRDFFTTFGFDVGVNMERNMLGWERVWANRDGLENGDMVDVECWGQEKSYGNFYVASRISKTGARVSVVLPGYCSEPRELDESSDSFPEKNFTRVFGGVIGEPPLVDDEGKLSNEGKDRMIFFVVNDECRRVKAGELSFPEWENSAVLE